MELFTHINELGDAGYAQLRTLIVAFPRLTLWAPSSSFMSELRTRPGNELLPTPEELLRYVERGHVRIMARRWWYEDPNRRAAAARGSWVHKRWDEDFDGVLRRFVEEDRAAGRDDASSRVLLVPDEDGWSWAERVLREDERRVAPLLTALQSHRDLVRYVEKARAARSEREAALSLLRDARNHGDALGRSGADRNLGAPADRALQEVLVAASVEHSAPTGCAGAAQSAVDAATLVEAVDGMLDRIRSAVPRRCATVEEREEHLHELLGDPAELAKFRNWVAMGDSLVARGGAHVEEALREYLCRQLGHAPPEDWKAKLRGSPAPWIFGLVVESAFSALSTFAPETWDGLFATREQRFAIEVAAFSLSQGWLQDTGLVPTRYDGDRWPFYVGWGSAHVTTPRKARLYEVLTTRTSA